MDAAEKQWLLDHAAQLGLTVTVKVVHGDVIWTSIAMDGLEYPYALDLKLLRSARLSRRGDASFLVRLHRIRDELSIKTWLLPPAQPWVWDGRDA